MTDYEVLENMLAFFMLLWMGLNAYLFYRVKWKNWLLSFAVQLMMLMMAIIGGILDTLDAAGSTAI